MDSLVSIIVDLFKKVTAHVVKSVKTLLQTIERELEVSLRALLKEVLGRIDGEKIWRSLFANL